MVACEWVCLTTDRLCTPIYLSGVSSLIITFNFLNPPRHPFAIVISVSTLNFLDPLLTLLLRWFAFRERRLSLFKQVLCFIGDLSSSVLLFLLSFLSVRLLGLFLVRTWISCCSPLSFCLCQRLCLWPPRVYLPLLVVDLFFVISFVGHCRRTSLHDWLSMCSKSDHRRGVSFLVIQCHVTISRPC